jgi:hypothetical protein
MKRGWENTPTREHCRGDAPFKGALLETLTGLIIFIQGQRLPLVAPPIALGGKKDHNGFVKRPQSCHGSLDLLKALYFLPIMVYFFVV